MIMPVSSKKQTLIDLKERMLKDLGTMHDFLVAREFSNAIDEILAKTKRDLDEAGINKQPQKVTLRSTFLAGYNYLLRDRNASVPAEDPTDLSEIESLKKEIMMISFFMQEMKEKIDDLDSRIGRILPETMRYDDLDEVLKQAKTYITEHETQVKTEKDNLVHQPQVQPTTQEKDDEAETLASRAAAMPQPPAPPEEENDRDDTLAPKAAAVPQPPAPPKEKDDAAETLVSKAAAVPQPPAPPKEDPIIGNILSAMQKAKESCRNNWLVNFGEKAERTRKAREMRDFREKFQRAETPELKNKALLNFIFSSIEARETFLGIKQAKNGEAKSAEVFFKALDENGKKFVASALGIEQSPMNLNAFRTAAISKRAEIKDINTFHPRMK